jgi:purine-binding chemotaxis protein CheW
MLKEMQADWVLVCSVGSHRCAIPLRSIAETMRPLPVDPIRGAPSFVMGLSMIRGAPVPVLEAGLLLFGANPASEASRFVTLDLNGRQVALAVTSVNGVRRLPAHPSSLPPLLAGDPASRIEAVAPLDSELHVVLNEARLVPESLWAELESSPA